MRCAKRSACHGEKGAEALLEFAARTYARRRIFSEPHPAIMENLMRTGKDTASRPSIAPLLLAVLSRRRRVLAGPFGICAFRTAKDPRAARSAGERPEKRPDRARRRADHVARRADAGSAGQQAIAARAPTRRRAPSDDAKPVEVIYDISKVPEPVRRMREQIVEAAASGDLERLAAADRHRRRHRRR